VTRPCVSLKELCARFTTTFAQELEAARTLEVAIACRREYLGKHGCLKELEAMLRRNEIQASEPTAIAIAHARVRMNRLFDDVRQRRWGATGTTPARRDEEDES
jgi:hypothetical protein